ncbi:universal stress protein [Actinophytocola gossypii]|uniref:Universal stress protein n=1 Tax=Actinophytocola gossypii TaxID=2812003 RepID=A0ABT2JDX9_9PSEU|nr:universal stress protein [Actinophytocola gossypii]MCT2586088.1 universal stress protein [Actinophytocola gossypii]
MPGFEIGKDGLAVIVVGVDGGERAQNAAAWATGLARRERARLVLVYVEPLTSPAYWSPIGMATAAEAASEFVQELRESAERYLDAVGVRWELVHYRGDPAHGLEAVAEDRRADCIVVGRGGGVPKTLVTEARRPVVIVP